MQFDLKKIQTESKVPLAIVTGLAAGNLAFKAVSSKLNPLVSSLILAAAGLFIAVNVKPDFVKNTALAACAFGGLKMLNTMSGDTTSMMSGMGNLGIALPDSVKNAIRNIFPTLNGDDDMHVIGAYDDFGTVDTDYQIVGTDDLVLPRLNGAEIDVAGLDGRRNPASAWASFKPKPNNAASPSRMLPAASARPAANPSAHPGARPMNLTCQVAGLGEVSVDIA